MFAGINNRLLLTRSFSLLGQPFLKSPADFPTVQRAAVAACLPHVKSISQSIVAPTFCIHTAREVLQRLDAVSDTLCRVLDSAEACRNLSSSEEWRCNADSAFNKLASFMYELNGHEPLYRALCKITDDAVLRSSLNPQESRLADLLKTEFERDGIGRTAEVRGHIGALKGRLEDLGSQFSNALHGSVPLHFTAPLTVWGRPLKEVLPPAVLASAGQSEKGQLIASPALVAHCLRNVPSMPLRRAAFLAASGEYLQNIPTLEALRRGRHELASLAGAASFADMAQGERLLDTSTDAAEFLSHLARALLPRAALETATLAAAKDRFAVEDEGVLTGDTGRSESSHPITPLERLFRLLSSSHPSTPHLAPWDVPFYSSRASRAALDDGSKDSTAQACAYFPLSSVLQGLSMIMRRVFGVECKDSQFSVGERWIEEGEGDRGGFRRLWRFELTHETEGALGVLYLDPFPRAGKFPGAAHFVIRCGKRVGAFDASLEKSLGLISEPTTESSASSEHYRLPTIALALNIQGVEGGGMGERTLLSPVEVETLFHEWGHATHSLLSRSHFQHTSGTRGALDTVEIPSHLFEYWAREWGSVSQFARHHVTGESLPKELWDRVQAARGHWRANEILSLTAHAMTDIALFGGQRAEGLALQGIALGSEQVETLAADAKETIASGGGEFCSSTVKFYSAHLPPRVSLVGVHLGPSLPPTLPPSNHAEEPLQAYDDSLHTPSLASSTEIWDTVSCGFNILPHLRGGSAHGGWSHTVSYGGGYYTYAVATVASAALWRHLFSGDPFSRSSGEILRQEFLALGGAGDPKKMLRACLDGSLELSLYPLVMECHSAPLALVPRVVDK